VTFFNSLLAEITVEVCGERRDRMLGMFGIKMFDGVNGLTTLKHDLFSPPIERPE
jgi:hypothetical protein